MTDLTKLTEPELRVRQNALNRALASIAQRRPPSSHSVQLLTDVHTELTRRGLYIL